MKGQTNHFSNAPPQNSGRVFSQQSNQSYGKGGQPASTWSNPPVHNQASSLPTWQNQPSQSGKGGPNNGKGKGGGKAPGFTQGNFGPSASPQDFGRGRGAPLQSGLTMYQHAHAGKGGGGSLQQLGAQQGSEQIRIQR